MKFSWEYVLIIILFIGGFLLGMLMYFEPSRGPPEEEPEEEENKEPELIRPEALEKYIK